MQATDDQLASSELGISYDSLNKGELVKLMPDLSSWNETNVMDNIVTSMQATKGMGPRPNLLVHNLARYRPQIVA